jgi:iron complex transport system ATP-binding protein
MDQVIRFADVSLRRGDRTILGHVDWTVRPSERWVVLGPNGSGKTSALRIAGAELQPSSGVVEVLGHRFGAVDLRVLRAQIGTVSSAVARSLDPRLSVEQVVLTGIDGTLAPWWSTTSAADIAVVAGLLDELDLRHLAPQPFAVASEGERQRSLLARALVSSPSLLLLDEPFAGLDLGARERLLTRLDATMQKPDAPPVVLVTHHTEEIPTACTHALLVRDGGFVACGPIDEVLTSANLSTTFGVAVQVRHHNGRWATVAG